MPGSSSGSSSGPPKGVTLDQRDPDLGRGDVGDERRVPLGNRVAMRLLSSPRVARRTVTVTSKSSSFWVNGLKSTDSSFSAT
jgi:hypothetical protein